MEDATFPDKFVEFDKWCSTCKYSQLWGDKEPCNECLTNPVNLNSTKPVKWEAKDDA